VDLFWEAHEQPPEQIILDLDATDEPLHGHQEGRFFRHLLAAKLRRANIDAAAGAVEEVARIVAQIRKRWPKVRILLRGDSGFARESLMAWCEANRVDYLLGLARNERLVAAISTELKAARQKPKRPESRRVGSLISAGPRWRVGAASGGWWARPSGPRTRPIHGLW
jgi:hypothetical protein